MVLKCFLTLPFGFFHIVFWFHHVTFETIYDFLKSQVEGNEYLLVISEVFSSGSGRMTANFAIKVTAQNPFGTDNKVKSQFL